MRSAVPHPEAKLGLVYGLSAYLLWGLSPIYFKAVIHVPAMQILWHRIIWSLLFLLALLTMRGGWGELWREMSNRRTLLLLAANALLIATNWMVFIYAIGRGLILHASLGYFINPLVSVLLAVLFLHERLRLRQIAGIALAGVGVSIFAIEAGGLPWISLILAMSFGLYGLLRKKSSVGPLAALMIETALLAPLAMVMIGVDLPRAMETYTGWTWGLLMCSCLITAVPLLWFAQAVRRLRLSTIGLLQYLAPTCNFLLAVFAFGEPFSWTKLIAFCFIWTALGVYTTDSWRAWSQASRVIPVSA